MTIKQVLIKTKIKLAKISETPWLDAEVLLSFVLKKPKIWLYGHPEKNINKLQEKKLKNLVAKRLKGEPMAYLIGHKEFFGLDFKVNKNVLIPCPETELLVEEVLKSVPNSNPPVTSADGSALWRTGGQILNSITIADIGTGSGNIAITLAKHLPSAKFFAVDISKNALRVAKKNAKKHNVNKRITFLTGPLLKPLPKKVDILVANLPYIPSQKARHLAHSPLIALDGGRDGLKFYQSLLKNAADYLKNDGKIFLEIDPSQTAKIKKLSKKYFPTAQIKIKGIKPCVSTSLGRHANRRFARRSSLVEIKKDLAGLNRLAIIFYS